MIREIPLHVILSPTICFSPMPLGKQNQLNQPHQSNSILSRSHSSQGSDSHNYTEES